MIGRSRESAAESAEITSAPSRSRRTAATSVLPEAVGPKSARSGGLGRAGRLLEAMRDVAGRPVGVLDHRDRLFGMLGPPWAGPLHRTLDPFFQRHLRLVAQDRPRLRHVCDVMRPLPEQRWRDG